MEDFRSKSCKMGSFYGGKATSPPSNMQDLRSYSVNYANPPALGYYNKEIKIKKTKSTFGSSASSKNWSFNDPELQRKKRVASYKVYTVEGKMKGSLRKSLNWIKNTYREVVYGRQ